MFDATVFFLIFCTVGFCSISVYQVELVMSMLFCLFLFLFKLSRVFLQAIRNLQLNIVLLVVCVLSALTEAFVFCYFGTMTTDSFSKYVDRAYEIHWCNLPVRLQKQLITFLGILQQPLEYRGFGMVTLNTMTFVKVMLNTY